MIHPRLTPLGATIGGSSSMFLAQIAPYAWTDLAFTTRWGDGAAGMFEASWNMPLPPGFSHPLLRRGTLVELMDGGWRVGSPLVMSAPEVGTGVEGPWQITCTGIGREVEGANSFYALNGSNQATAVPSTAVDQAIVRGWRIAGRDASVPTTTVASSDLTDGLNTVGSLLNAAADAASKRWLVDQTNTLVFASDPTTPTWHVTPGSASLGVADDDYATTVLAAYLNSSSGAYATVTAPATPGAAEGLYGHREYGVDLTPLGAISTATAQGYANGILAKYKGRLAWTNGLTLASNELLTTGGVPASLSMVEAGQMIRIHGIFDDLLSYSGQTWLDIVIGETKYTDGAQTIDINPLGLAPRDLAKVVESVTGLAAAA